MRPIHAVLGKQAWRCFGSVEPSDVREAIMAKLTKQIQQSCLLVEHFQYRNSMGICIAAKDFCSCSSWHFTSAINSGHGNHGKALLQCSDFVDSVDCKAAFAAGARCALDFPSLGAQDAGTTNCQGKPKTRELLRKPIATIDCIRKDIWSSKTCIHVTYVQYTNNCAYIILHTLSYIYHHILSTAPASKYIVCCT